MPGAEGAAEPLLAAVSAGRRIVVYGDYDVDGISGTALFYVCLLLSVDG